jgi:hypothetical protein
MKSIASRGLRKGGIGAKILSSLVALGAFTAIRRSREHPTSVCGRRGGTGVH